MPYHTFTISWPHKFLSPNGRPGNRFAKNDKAQAHKNEAWGAALGSGIRQTDRAHIHFTLHPKAKGPLPDQDNAQAALKYAQDGIALALGMDDRDISVSYTHSTERRDCVVVNISTGEAALVPLKGTIS